MVIVNVTPDSFSDGGQFSTTETALVHARSLVTNGADVLDIGGESTRPGSRPVSIQEEIDRVAPVVETLAKEINIPISVDTSKAEVAQTCVSLGAEIINDVTGFRGDPQMISVAAKTNAGLVVMHMLGTPRTMQQSPEYDDVVTDIRDFFAERVQKLVASGISRERIVIDPGIGFGKTLAHNLGLVRRLFSFRELGLPILLGVSRKSFLAKVLHRETHERLAGSLAVACFAMSRNAVDVLRVHDVAETCDVVRMWRTLDSSPPE